MMYFMDGKTFLKKYIATTDPKKILKTQFVIVSSFIRKTPGTFEKQIINANNILYPSQRLIIDYSDYSNNDEYIKEYRKSLKEHKAFFATFIKYDLEEKHTGDIVFLCSYTERKYYYLNIISEYVYDVFGYRIFNYNKIKGNKCKDIEYTLNKCNKILKKKSKKKISKKDIIKYFKEHKILYNKKWKRKDLLKMYKNIITN